ncbi:MAG: DUF1772 domain-containing protein [Bacteroidetes bacterium]|nr:DUF1772 domain-containing protein [Bacteroidota bacterium]
MATIVLAIALLLCSLTAGFLFAFAVVVMPGLKALDDTGYLRAFQLVDGVIQNNQPFFMLVWGGSILAMLAALGTGVVSLVGIDLILLLAAGVLYLGGVQLPTIAIHLPLNAKVQRINFNEIDASALHEARVDFETRWNRWNVRRTVIAVSSVVLMLVLLVRL